MASWTIPTTYVTGSTLSVSAWNALANDALFLYQAPYISAYNSSATSLVNNTNTQVALSITTEYANYGFGVTSNNVVIPSAVTGVYMTMFGVGAVAASGSLYGYITQNSTAKAYGSVSTLNSSTGAASTGSKVLKCTASDTIGLFALQNSGGAVNTSATSANTYLSMAFIGSV